MKHNHPHYLIIDNCSGSGRRIDVETLSRSIPLWRSDRRCTFNCDAEASQCHNTGISCAVEKHGYHAGRGVYRDVTGRDAFSRHG